ncbi:MAG: thioredoxin [Candidatus Thermoplasmatota archaeon]|jgi:thioredoxin 1|nr:thioredoxin [Candidatus Thermoplasmatota archaeon]
MEAESGKESDSPTKGKWTGFFRGIFSREPTATEETPGEDEPVSRPTPTSTNGNKGKPVVLTTVNFSRVVEENPRVVVDFWAPWCRPCRALSPILEATAHRIPDGVVVGKVNIDHQPTLARKWNVKSIPTLVVFCEGKPVDRMVGVIGAEALQAKLTRSFKRCD